MIPAALPGKAERGVNKSNTTRPGLPPSENHTIYVFTGSHPVSPPVPAPTQASNPAAGAAGEAPGKFPSDNRRPSPQPPNSAQSNVSKTQERYKSGVADKLETADKT